jgi:hypothetical protein
MLKIITNKPIPKDNQVSCGQFYQRVDHDDVYFVTRTYCDGNDYYGLINLKYGVPYKKVLERNINDIFGNHKDRFVLVEDVTITLNH